MPVRTLDAEQYSQAGADQGTEPWSERRGRSGAHLVLRSREWATAAEARADMGVISERGREKRPWPSDLRGCEHRAGVVWVSGLNRPGRCGAVRPCAGTQFWVEVGERPLTAQRS
jgi:hypothetical protein